MNRNQEAAKIWNERHVEQLRFIKLVLENRGYKHNIENEEEFNDTVGKIIFHDEHQDHICYLTDSCITFKNLDLCLTLDEFSLWLDS
ncbi:hypothetical protein DS893_14620 [Vibrionales bacterium C3R12]|nr:hypothetical protein DS893_14620 [Vibrionales bacterium C3R12]